MNFENSWSNEGNKLYFNKQEVRLTDEKGMPASEAVVLETLKKLQEDPANHATMFWTKRHVVLHLEPGKTVDVPIGQSIIVKIEPLPGTKIGVEPQHLASHEKIHPLFEPQDVSRPIQAKRGPLLGQRTGHILSQSAQNYVRKLQLEGKAPPNSFLDNTKEPHKGKLEHPVFIGKNGEPIALYDKVTRSLGKGQYGQVYLGVNIDTGKACAVKKHTAGSLSAIVKEEEILKAMGLLLDKIDFKDRKEGYTAIELAWGTDIGKYLQDKTVSYEKKIHVLKLMFEKINALHKLGYVHRDIKPENLMYDPDADVVRVIDLGFAVKLTNGKALDFQETGTPFFEPKGIAGCGTILEKTYSPVTDIYSAGITAACTNRSRNRK